MNTPNTPPTPNDKSTNIADLPYQQPIEPTTQSQAQMQPQVQSQINEPLLKKGQQNFNTLPNAPPTTIDKTPPKVGGPGQGISAYSPFKKEFFGLKENDYKTTALVFALVLIFSNGLFFSAIKTYLPAVSNENGVTFIGSLIAALLASIIFITLKCVCNLS